MANVDWFFSCVFHVDKIPDFSHGDRDNKNKTCQKGTTRTSPGTTPGGQAVPADLLLRPRLPHRCLRRDRTMATAHRRRHSWPPCPRPTRRQAAAGGVVPPGVAEGGEEEGELTTSEGEDVVGARAATGEAAAAEGIIEEAAEDTGGEGDTKGETGSREVERTSVGEAREGEGGVGAHPGTTLSFTMTRRTRS